jgi:hypothetical protein
VQSIYAFAQESNYATVNFFSPSFFGSSPTLDIYLNDQLITSINTGKNFIFKMYSEGRISVKIKYPNSSGGFGVITSTLDIKQGNIYYFRLDFVNGRFMQVSETEAYKFLKKPKKIKYTFEGKEDKNKPIK